MCIKPSSFIDIITLGVAHGREKAVAIETSPYYADGSWLQVRSTPQDHFSKSLRCGRGRKLASPFTSATRADSATLLRSHRSRLPEKCRRLCLAECPPFGSHRHSSTRL